MTLVHTQTDFKENYSTWIRRRETGGGKGGRRGRGNVRKEGGGVMGEGGEEEGEEAGQERVGIKEKRRR